VTARQRSTTAVKRWLFLRFFGSLDVNVTGCTSSSSNDPVRPHTTLLHSARASERRLEVHRVTSSASGAWGQVRSQSSLIVEHAQAITPTFTPPTR
jgi:hypothetical protein